MVSCVAFMMAGWAAMRRNVCVTRDLGEDPLRQGAGNARMYRDRAAISPGSRRLFAVAGLRG